MEAAELAVALPSPTERLMAFINGGGHLGLEGDLLTEAAAKFAGKVVTERFKFGGWLDMILVRALPKYAIAAARDIRAAWDRYNRWLMTQRKRVDEVARRRMANRRDQTITNVIAGLIVSFKFIGGVRA